MHLRRIIFTLLFFPGFSVLLYAQEIISVDTIRLPFESLTINDGLSQGFVRTIAQDHDGFMWFGSNDGLNRYDGYHFTVLRHDPLDTNSIPSNFITALFVDSRGWLWTGFNSGEVGVLETRCLKFTTLPAVKFSAEFTEGFTNFFAEDIKGNIWILSNNGIVHQVVFNQKKIPPSAGQRVSCDSLKFPDIGKSLYEKYGIGFPVYSLAFTATGNVWLAGNDSLVELNPSSNEKPVRQALKTFTGEEKNSIQSIALDHTNNHLIIATSSLTIIYDLKNNSVISSYKAFLRHDPYRSTDRFDQQNNFWFIDKNIGFLQPNRKHAQIVLPQLSNSQTTRMQFSSLLTVFIDKTGIIWIGTNAHGILKLNPRTLSFHTFIPSDFTSIGRLSPASDGNVIACIAYPMYYKGVSKTFDKILTKKKLGGFQVNDAVEDTDGTIWCLLAPGGGLLHYDPKKNTVERFSREDIIARGKSFFPLYFDRSGEIWFGMVSNGIPGFFLFDRTRKQVVDSIIFPRENRLNEMFISQIYESQNTFWFATAGGLFSYDKKKKNLEKFVSVAMDTSTLGSNNLLCICPDLQEPEEILWIGTDGGGLNRFDIHTGKVLRITDKNGLPNNVVYGILSDDKGNLWMSTNRGIARYDPGVKSFTSYVQSDGLQSNEFNRFAFCKTTNGELYFGGVNGFNHFFPSEIKSNPLPPLINFTSIRIFNRDFLSGTIPNGPEKEVRLEYRQNMITIEFAAMDYTVPSKNQYYYKLEGFNNDWISNGTKNEVTFTNLDPGHYTFVVKAANSSGVWNEEGKSLSFLVLPPWYMTWWFRISMILVAGAIVYALYRYRINQLLKMQAVRNRIADDLHDEIGSTLSSVSIYSRVVQNRTKGKVPEAEPYLERINSDISSMMEAMSDIVWTINSSNDRFENTFSRMRSSAAELLEAKGYALHFEFDERMNDLKLGMEARRNLYLVFKEALNNIAKYANGKNVWITLQRNHSDIVLQIRDDGKGFVVGTTNGNGMNSMKTRAEELKAELLIASVVDEGTTVTLQVPIG